MSITFRSEEYGDLLETLLRGGKPTTEAIVNALREDGVDEVIIEYLADLHIRKVEGKRGKDISSRRNEKMFMYFRLYQDVLDRANRNGKALSHSEALSQVAEKAGCSVKTVKRHLPPLKRAE